MFIFVLQDITHVHSEKSRNKQTQRNQSSKLRHISKCVKNLTILCTKFWIELLIHSIYNSSHCWPQEMNQVIIHCLHNQSWENDFAEYFSTMFTTKPQCISGISLFPKCNCEIKWFYFFTERGIRSQNYQVASGRFSGVFRVL